MASKLLTSSLDPIAALGLHPDELRARCQNLLILRPYRDTLRRIKSSVHGSGVVSQIPLSRGDVVCDYYGVLVPREGYCPSGTTAAAAEPDDGHGQEVSFLFGLSDLYQIDPTRARRAGPSSSGDAANHFVPMYINHSCEPNCVSIGMNMQRNLKLSPLEACALRMDTHASVVASLIAAGPAVAHDGGTDDGNEGSEDRDGDEGEGSEGNTVGNGVNSGNDGNGEDEEDEEDEEGAAGGGRTSGTKRKRKAPPSTVRLRPRPHALLRRPRAEKKRERRAQQQSPGDGSSASEGLDGEKHGEGEHEGPDDASSDTRSTANRSKLSTYLQAPLELDDVVILIAARAIPAGEELSFDYCRASLPAPANGPSGGGVGSGVGGGVGGGVEEGTVGSDVGGSNDASGGVPRGCPSDGSPALAHRDKGTRLQQCRCGSASCRLTF